MQSIYQILEFIINFFEAFIWYRMGKIILIAVLELFNKKRNAVMIDIDQMVIKFAVVLILTNLILFLGVYFLFCNTRYLTEKTVFVILNIKKALAAEKDISFESTVVLNTLPLSDLEICSLFGNILDNAIEAAKIFDEKYIELNIKETKNAWNIQCMNSYLVSPVFEGDILKSTKNNKEVHGIGIQNIKEIVIKYGGMIY